LRLQARLRLRHNRTEFYNSGLSGADVLNCYEMKVRPRRTFEPLKAAGLSPLWGEQ